MAKTKKLGSKLGSQVTKYEKQWREDIVYDFHLWGYTQHEIKDKVNNGGDTGQDDRFRWNVTQPTICYYLRDAMKRKAKERDITDTLELLRESKKRWQSIIKTAKEAGNIENVRLCQRELDKLNGLEQITINLNVNDIRNKTDDELLKELSTLKDANKGK